MISPKVRILLYGFIVLLEMILSKHKLIISKTVKFRGKPPSGPLKVQKRDLLYVEQFFLQRSIVLFEVRCSQRDLIFT